MQQKNGKNAALPFDVRLLFWEVWVSDFRLSTDARHFCLSLSLSLSPPPLPLPHFLLQSFSQSSSTALTIFIRLRTKQRRNTTVGVSPPDEIESVPAISRTERKADLSKKIILKLRKRNYFRSSIEVMPMVDFWNNELKSSTDSKPRRSSVQSQRKPPRRNKKQRLKTSNRTLFPLVWIVDAMVWWSTEPWLSVVWRRRRRRPTRTRGHWGWDEENRTARRRRGSLQTTTVSCWWWSSTRSTIRRRSTLPTTKNVNTGSVAKESRI